MLLILQTFNSGNNQPVLYILPIKKQNNRRNAALFISTISMTPGLFCVMIKDDEFVIHCLDQKYFKQSLIDKIHHNLHYINDDLLV